MQSFVHSPSIIAIVTILAMTCLALFQHSRKRKHSTYKMGPPLFSPAERSFLGTLDQAVGGTYRVFGKVRVADVLAPSNETDSKRWRAAFNRIAAKHFDFVICSVDDLKIVCAVELDDSSHGSKLRTARDAFLAEACEQSGLPLLRIAVRLPTRS